MPTKRDRTTWYKLRADRAALEQCVRCGEPAARIPLADGSGTRAARMCQPHLDADADRASARALRAACVVCAGGTGNQICAPCAMPSAAEDFA